MMSAITASSSTALTAITGRPGSRPRQDNIHAVLTTNTGLRNSDGWTRKPSSSQRLAPLTSVPRMGTSASATSATAQSTIEPRRASCSGTIEVTSITARPTICQRTCSQKKCSSKSVVALVESRPALAGEAAATASQPSPINISTR